MRNLKSFLYNVMAEELENVAQTALYCPFGELIYEENAFWMLDTIPRFLFNGKELDEESGMYYYSARYYSPPSFISRDPLFEEYPTTSPYAYCSNNPVNRIDPDGREDFDVDGDYYDKNGRWLFSDGIKDNKAYVQDENGSTFIGSTGTFTELPITNDELLDRSTWVHGESGGSDEVITDRTQNAGDASDARVVDYYANAINNAVKSDGSFEKTLKMRMSKEVNEVTVNTSAGYFNGTGSGGNSNSKAFANARKQGMSSLMRLPNAKNSISAVIKSVSAGNTDPTGGARAWLGGSYANRYVNNSNARTSRAIQYSPFVRPIF